ncbi:class I adenylate-forming enzyme family protein [Propionispora hippei]|uniref:Long-chain acyl-CoA synthetase n=1 Tax=Propionispora hippei DSM 15287 TaxID=1123003 RepID=A0A1M6PBI4_9FIRM|nr:class I adenylate-forming enzyme family protein [Propionispora hippei]SHK05329.1 long-chain acyl-CoA synthetase [Propionispora hippei DSM 15287]
MIRNLFLNQTKLQQPAVIDGEICITFQDLIQKSRAIEVRLPQSPWENAAIYLPDGSDFIAALFGIIRLGKTAFPFNAHLTRHEIIPLLKQTVTDIIITSSTFRPVMEEIKALSISNLLIIYIEECQPEGVIDILCPNDTGEDEPMILLPTSGSTGRAKIVSLSERNIESSVQGYIDKMCFENMPEKKIRYILAAPLSTAYGLMILCACLMKSFPIVLLKEGFTLDTFYKTVEKHSVTHYEGGAMVPLLMEQTAGRPVPYDIHGLKCFGFGGSKVSGEALRRLLHAYPGIQLWQGYGMTEAAPLIAKCTNPSTEKLDSVGQAIKGVTIFIEADGMIKAAPYTVGEILVKGPNVMSGYYKNEEETKKVLKNGCLYTGDIGYLDEDGYLYICGRKKNVIIVRGFNVHPEEVETCILNSLLAADCVVYGKVDSTGNEIVCADIIPQDASVCREKLEEKIRTYCKTHLSGVKQPRKIQIVDMIRKTMTGKIERKRGE